MKYSFVVPIYNCKDYLADCVKSIRSVGAENYEIVLVDDGSTDGSGAICDALAENYTEVRVVHQSNSGASSARNRGLQESSGEKVLFIDADDTLEAEELGNILSDPRCSQSDLVIYGLTFDYYFHGKCYRRDPMYFAYDGVLNTNEWGGKYLELFSHNSLSPLWNKVFKRDILQKNRLLLNTDMFLYEDFEFVLRYMAHCDTVWNVPAAIYHYRQPEDEGNAGRRLQRIPSIADFMIPIERSLDLLRTANSAITEKQAAAILQLLHLTLSREKLAVSNLSEIHAICDNFRQWAIDRELPVEASKYQKNLMEDKALLLYVNNKKTVLRHWLAVRVKAYLNKI